jgi:cellulose synthase/poly-beta-1,6-N-acetylglucosamine synthase-like glycosyltransferase
MIVLAHLLLAVLALPAVAAAAYLLLLTLLSTRLPRPPPSTRQLRFDVVVPAHNESAVIANCLASLRRLDWPADRFRLLVIADNCDDSTAAVASAAGAQVLERVDATLRGKGYALRLAFDDSRRRAWADAVAVVDADTEVSVNLLEAFAARIESGAGVVQAHYGVLNPSAPWRTSLMAIAHGAFHGVRSRARERLRLSCGLRGNGWCITRRTLAAVPYRAFSLTEDLEYGIALGLAGVRVHYADEAWANGEMESAEAVAVRQRQRWEDGRFDLMRTQAPRLLLTAWRQRSRIALDLALDLLVPPLSYVALNVAVFAVAAASATLWQAGLRIWLWPVAFSCAGLLVYVLRGWQLSGRGAAGLLDLLRAPFFVIWKLTRVLRAHDRSEWAPTRRRGP